ncbi:hypothetical protein WUBG_06551, partial [Wuchereria bancrofti]
MSDDGLVSLKPFLPPPLPSPPPPLLPPPSPPAPPSSSFQPTYCGAVSFITTYSQTYTCSHIHTYTDPPANQSNQSNQTTKVTNERTNEPTSEIQHKEQETLASSSS